MCLHNVFNMLVFMQSFIEDLLNLRLLRDGVLELVNETFNLHEALEFVIEMFQIKAHAYGMDVSYSTEYYLELPNKNSCSRYDKAVFRHDEGALNNNLPEILIGDERRFKQVLINLIKNALKFT